MPMRAPSRSSPAEAGRLLRGLLAAALLPACAGGGSGSGAPPEILEQPGDTAAFVGETAVFQLHASGTGGLTYQWRRNGVDLPGATDSHLVTPPATLADDGTIYSVFVVNLGGGSLESQPARLSVFPPLDLRFQGIGAPFTLSYDVFGYLQASTYSAETTTYGSGHGTPLVLPGYCGVEASYASCGWPQYVAPAPGMTTVYHSGRVEDVGGWAAGLAPDSVVTSLDLEEAAGVYAASLAQTTQTGAFSSALGTAAPDALQAAASAEAAQGRVITAASFQGGLIGYVSTAWSRDPATVYEARTVVTTFDQVQVEAIGLAAKGYLLTAAGAGNGGANGYVLVGTRVQGSSSPRSISFSSDIGALQRCVVVGDLVDPAHTSDLVICQR